MFASNVVFRSLFIPPKVLIQFTDVDRAQLRGGFWLAQARDPQIHEPDLNQVLKLSPQFNSMFLICNKGIVWF